MKISKTVLISSSIIFIFSIVLNLKIQAKDALTKQYRIYVDARVLKIRKAPNLDAETVGKLDLGDSFVILEKGGERITVEGITSNWGKVSLKGMKGWVFLGFTSESAPELLSAKEIERIASKYERDVQKCEEREAAAMAASLNIKIALPADVICKLQKR